MSERQKSVWAGPGEAPGQGGPVQGGGAGHPAPPVFEPRAFALLLLGLFGTVALVPVAHAFLSDRLALPPPLATALTAALSAAFGILVGALTAWRFRRLAFYEIAPWASPGRSSRRSSPCGRTAGRGTCSRRSPSRGPWSSCWGFWGSARWRPPRCSPAPPSATWWPAPAGWTPRSPTSCTWRAATCGSARARFCPCSRW